MDTSTAFGTVNYNILLTILLNISFGVMPVGVGSLFPAWMGGPLWLPSVETTELEHRSVKVSVQQGSVLWLLLYILYTVDLTKIIYTLEA